MGILAKDLMFHFSTGVDFLPKQRANDVSWLGDIILCVLHCVWPLAVASYCWPCCLFSKTLLTRPKTLGFTGENISILFPSLYFLKINQVQCFSCVSASVCPRTHTHTHLIKDALLPTFRLVCKPSIFKLIAVYQYMRYANARWHVCDATLINIPVWCEHGAGADTNRIVADWSDTMVGL